MIDAIFWIGIATVHIDEDEFIDFMDELVKFMDIDACASIDIPITESDIISDATGTP